MFIVYEHLVHFEVDEVQLELIEVRPLLIGRLEDGLVIEHEADASARAQGAAHLVEIAADVGYRTGGVVRSGFDEDRDAVRTVPFVDHLLVIAGILRDSPFNGPFDILLGHVLGFRILDEEPELRVIGRIGTRLLYAYLYCFPYLGECTRHVAPALEFRSLTIFECPSHCIAICC